MPDVRLRSPAHADHGRGQQYTSISGAHSSTALLKRGAEGQAWATRRRVAGACREQWSVVVRAESPALNRLHPHSHPHEAWACRRSTRLGRERVPPRRRSRSSNCSPRPTTSPITGDGGDHGGPSADPSGVLRRRSVVPLPDAGCVRPLSALPLRRLRVRARGLHKSAGDRFWRGCVSQRPSFRWVMPSGPVEAGGNSMPEEEIKGGRETVIEDDA